MRGKAGAGTVIGTLARRLARVKYGPGASWAAYRGVPLACWPDAALWAYHKKERVPISDPEQRLCMISAIGADIEVDLTGSSNPKKPVKLDLDAWFSTIVIKTKPSWTIASLHDKYGTLGKSEAERPIYPLDEGTLPDIAVQGSVLFSTVKYR